MVGEWTNPVRHIKTLYIYNVKIRHSRYFQGATGASLLPVLLSRIGLAISVPVLPISDAVHCNRSRSALQPSPQCTASARTYLVYFKRKYMRPPGITFATADANVINRGCKRYKPLPQTFAGKGAHLGIPSPMVFQMSLEQVIDSH